MEFDDYARLIADNVKEATKNGNTSEVLRLLQLLSDVAIELKAKLEGELDKT